MPIPPQFLKHVKGKGKPSDNEEQSDSKGGKPNPFAKKGEDKPNPFAKGKKSKDKPKDKGKSKNEFIKDKMKKGGF